MKLTRVAEPEFQYGIEVFEAHQHANVEIAIKQREWQIKPKRQ